MKILAYLCTIKLKTNKIMEKAVFIKELTKVLTGFNFDEEMNTGKYISGDKKVPQIEYKDENKATVRVEGVRSIYISPKMGTETVLFYYAIIKTRGQKREYRRKKFYDAEIDKVFLSGKTYELLLQEFKNQLTLVNG